MKQQPYSSFLLVPPSHTHHLTLKPVLLASLLCETQERACWTMFARGLLICVVLRAFSAQAKVVSSFNECSGFFYDGTEPAGLDQNAKRICQKVEYGGFYYATLYSVPHRMPLYSAYTLDRDCTTTAGRTDVWHVETQVTTLSLDDQAL